MLFVRILFVKPLNFNKREFYEFLYDFLPQDHYEYVIELFEKAIKSRSDYEKHRDLIEGIGHG